MAASWPAFVVTQRNQGVDDVVRPLPRRRQAQRRKARRQRHGNQFAAQFQNHAFGGFLPMPGRGQAFDVFVGNCAGKFVGGHGGEYAQRGFRADAADFDQLAERRPLVGSRKAEQQMRVFTDDELGVKLQPFSPKAGRL